MNPPNAEDPTWYHGTRRGFQKGGLLVPRADHGKAGTTAPLAPGRAAPDDAVNHVYMTQDLDLAWAYAWAAPGRGKPKVLVLRPHGHIERDPEHSLAMNAWRAEWATVHQVLLQPSISEAEARAGWTT